MLPTNRIRHFVAAMAASAVLAFTMPAFAQDVPESHLKAAQAAIAAIHATDQFDDILPQAAVALESSLIQKNPDLQELIGTTVTAQALELASRRADLEKEAAVAYAKVFSEQELNDIATFYTTATGKKLLENGPIVSRELVKAANIWQNGIARDLAKGVGDAMQAAIGSKAPAVTPEDAAPASADGAQPAPSGN
jgi:hypothetical protein